ncbi:MAG: recombinase family protein [Thermosipho sp. (in: Bacteria)]|nr:recombinase family protein [Thermosipho sp. (in: thermotogales)]
MLEGIDNYCRDGRIFKAAIYCRLSREDEGLDQSESIKNQKDFLTRYVLEQGWELVDIYIDDGFTGTDFNRPGFKRLLEDIEKGRVNLIVTKDLSRLGRDYITTGYYIEKYFPERNIRYIAVNDGIDTFLNNPGNDITPFKSVINDMYARDISNKVRSAMDTKRREGKFIGAFAPFGYKKDPADKNRLVVDEETAPIVRRIFHMYLNGYGISKIAHILNSEGVITPSEYKAAMTGYRGKAKNTLWSHNTVKKILENPTYAGCLAQNKYRRVNYKSRKLKNVPRNRWIVVNGTHEPVVDMKTYNDVQEMLARNSNKDYSNRNKPRLLSGFVFCGDCGKYMTFTSTSSGVVYLVCSTYKRHTSRYCTRHSIKESELEQMVLEDIKRLAAQAVDRGRLLDAAKGEVEEGPHIYLMEQMKKIEKRINEIKRIIKSLYDDRVRGIIEEREFIELNGEFSRERNMLADKYNTLKKKVEEYKESSKKTEKLYSLIESLIDIKELDRYVLERLVSRIEVFENKEIKIHYKFKSPTL